MTDAVNHPEHYHSEYMHARCGLPIECIDIVRHMDFNLGNAIKYIWRAGKKGDALEDLRKANWYIADAITELERQAEEIAKAIKKEEDRAELLDRLHAPIYGQQWEPALTVEGIVFTINNADEGNKYWNAFNREPFYLSLDPAGRQACRDQLLEQLWRLPTSEFDKLASHVQEAVTDWCHATGKTGDC
jgi:hypothetical protein